MRRPAPSLIFLGGVAIAGLVAAPLLLDEETALTASLAVMAAFLVLYRIIRARERRRERQS